MLTSSQFCNGDAEMSGAMAEMNDQVRQRELGRALHLALSEQLGAERYRQRQWQARSGRAGIARGALPLEFDESGFPIAERNSGLVKRVARLLNPL